MEITSTIKYIGVYDDDIDLFEGQYIVPNGMAYNSYVILDEKIAVMDSVDIRFADQWISNIKTALDGRRPDYLIVQHMEPDHSSSIMKFTECFKDATIVASAKAFNMMSEKLENLDAARNQFVSDASHEWKSLKRIEKA